MHPKKHTIIVALLSLFLASTAQGAIPAWDVTFGGPANDSAASVQQTSDGGYIIAGTTSSWGAGGTDAWLIKTDYKGTRLWDRTFGGKGDDSAASVQQTSDGGYIIVGTTSSYGAGIYYHTNGTNAWLIKTDANGNLIWDRTFGGQANDSAASVQQTSDGGYIIAGTTSSYGAGIYYHTNGTNVWLIKTDYKGTRLWDRTFGGTGYDSAACVQQTSDDGYIIAGITSSYGAGGTDAWLIKTDANGNRLWDKTFGGTGYDSAACMQQTKEGGYIIAGTTTSYGAGGTDAWLIKTDANGTRLWDRTFGGPANDSAASVQQTSDGGYIIAGTTSSYGAGGTDTWLIKTDFRGNRLWDKTFGGTGYDSAASVQQTKEGSYIVAGNTTSYGAGGSDVWLLYVLDGASTTASSATTNKSIQGFDILTNVVGLLAAIYIVNKLKK